MLRGAALCMVVVSLIAASVIWQVSRDARVPIQASYDYDEGVYSATSDALARGSRLYQQVFLSQPPVLILMIRAMFALAGPSLAAARGAIELASAVWLIAIFAALWARGAPWGGTLAVCLLLGSTAFLGSAHTVEMEVPSEALACAAVALGAWGTRKPEPLWWAAAGALLGLAVMTKLTAVTGVIPIAAAIVAERRSAPVWRWAMIAAGGALILGVLLPVIGTAGFRDQVFAFHVVLARAHPESPAVHAETIVRFLAREWPLSAAATLGFWWSIRSGGWLERALLVWFAADCGLLIALTPLWEHHLIILLSPLALLAGTAVNHVHFRVRLTEAMRLGAGTTCSVAAMAYILVGASAVPPPVSSADLTRVASRISRVVPARGKILTDDPMVAFLARRPLAAGLVDTSLARIWAREISEDRLEAALREESTGAVVFWRGTFRQYFPLLEPPAVSLFPIVVPAQGGRLLLLRPAIHGP